jgi:predicted nucleic acid-binding protein
MGSRTERRAMHFMEDMRTATFAVLPDTIECFFFGAPSCETPNDDMVAEVAVASGARAIVTYNERDFIGVEKFGVKVWSPKHLLEGIKK